MNYKDIELKFRKDSMLVFTLICCLFILQMLILKSAIPLLIMIIFCLIYIIVLFDSLLNFKNIISKIDIENDYIVFCNLFLNCIITNKYIIFISGEKVYKRKIKRVLLIYQHIVDWRLTMFQLGTIILENDIRKTLFIHNIASNDSIIDVLKNINKDILIGKTKENKKILKEKYGIKL